MKSFSRMARQGAVLAIAIFVTIVVAQPAFAVKAYPKTVTYYQPDGTPFQAKMIGDERAVFVEDSEGRTVVKNAEGFWVYADPSSHRSPKLRATSLRAGIDEAPLAWAKHVRPLIDKQNLPGPAFEQQDDGSIGELFRQSRTGRGSRFNMSANAQNLTPTTVPVLVILVEFSDWKHTTGPNTPVAGEPGFNPIAGQPNNSATWQTLLGDRTVAGGLNHFYWEATYQRMQWNVTVAQRGMGQTGTGTLVNDGWYSNPQTMAYWGAAKSSPLTGCDEDKGSSSGGIKDLVTWAVQQANADVNFAVYDTDGNGSISDAELMIFVVHAREGQEMYGSGCDGSDPGNQRIWSHKWNMRVNVSVDGKTIPAGHIYAMEPEFTPEINYATNPWTITEKYFGVGVFAHEALHTLGAPDIYDTGYDATPAGDWDLMDSGSYNGVRSGTHPAHMGGPLKQDIKLNADSDAASYGFILESEITQVSTDGAKGIDGTGKGTNPTNVLHRIQASNNANEWFLLENRAPIGYYEPYLPEHGVVIWHRDRSVSGSSNSSYPYQANVLRKGWANTAAGLQTDTSTAAFSADDNQTTFTATTDPSNKLNNGSASGLKDIRCFSAEASNMTYAYGTVAGAHVGYAGNSVSGGDGDAWIDFGEAATLGFRVSNSACGGAAASNVTVAVTSSGAAIGAIAPSSFATVAAGQTVDFNVPVTLSCSTCQSVSFNYTIFVGGVASSSGTFAVETNRSYLWVDDGDAQAKSGWTSNPVPNFVPSACTSASRHGDWALVAHPTAPRGLSYRTPVAANGLTHPNPDEAWVSPNITIPAGTSIQQLRFSYAAEIPCLNYTRGRLWVSTDNGATWQRHEDFYRDGGDLSWEEVSTDLSLYAGATQIKFLFGMYTYTCQTGCSATRGIYVDNISVVTAQTTPSTPDTEAPTTSITAPANGATVSGTTNVTASASDNVAVARVEFFLDGVLASTDTTSPYEWSWNTASVSNGNYTLSSTAYDGAGNSGSSSIVTVTVNNVADTTAPATAITAPANGATVSGTTSVTASASDAVGVTSVEFYLDGVLQSTDTSSPYAWSWNTTTASNGAHTLTSKAYDAAGNVGTSATVNVTVSNSAADVTPPVITNVTSVKTNTKNGTFEIRWTTNEASTSDVVLNGTTYANATLVTNHVRSFRGTKGATYTYYVISTDAAGNASQAGPFTHVN